MTEEEKAFWWKLRGMTAAAWLEIRDDEQLMAAWQRAASDLASLSDEYAILTVRRKDIPKGEL